ncbi:MAG: leucine-rich repeat domain-containing protein [Bacteroidales bacterium]|nr:leucine-rich repeat domain-containing protein [Bacteroidales bacterium]
MTAIGSYAFYGCHGITKVSYNAVNANTSSPGRIFYNCRNLKTIIVGQEVTNIPNGIFRGCDSLKHVIYSATNATAGSDVFYGCNSLKTVTITANVQSIPDYIFNYHPLDSLSVRATTPPSVGANSFYIGGYTRLIVANSTVMMAYISHPVWTTFIISIEPGPANINYSVSVVSEDSTKGSATGSATVAEGGVTTISATANRLYHFTQWLDGNKENPRTVTVVSDMAYTACFASNIVDITETVCSSTTWHDRTYSSSGVYYWITPATSYIGDSVQLLYLSVNQCVAFKSDGNWNDSTKWSTGEVPGSGDDVLVVADATIPDGCTAYVNSISIDGGSITIADGGQLLATNSVPVTVQKEVSAATWHAIAAPVNNNSIAPLTSGIYDLFAYDEEHGTWLNQKEHGDFALGRGLGYVYRRAAATTVSFEGNTNVSNISGLSLSWRCADGGLKGFNLVGNPYPHNIYLGAGLQTTGCAAGYYTLQRDGTWRVATSGPIAVGQAALLQATGNDATVSFIDDATAPAAKSATAGLTFTLSDGRHEDVTIATFGEGAGLRKVSHLNAEAPMLYIPQEDADYAVAMVGEDVEEFPLHMRTVARGQYTLNVAGVVPGMQIIDMQTGRTIAMPYSFEGSGTARFLVRMRPYDGDRPFAFQNGGNVVVAGEGTLQAYDIMGRLLFSSEVNNQLSIPSSKFPATGVYLLRLGGKSQKIVIK